MIVRETVIPSKPENYHGRVWRSVGRNVKSAARIDPPHCRIPTWCGSCGPVRNQPEIFKHPFT